MAEPDHLDDADKSNRVRPAQQDPRYKCDERLAGFVKRYGVKRFEHGPRNLSELLKQGGAPEAEVKRVLVRYFQVSHGVILDAYGKGHPFDHAEVWGRDRTPLYLIGHPYEVWGDALETIYAIRQLGMNVMIHAASWYGYGTVQVQVCHYDTVKRITNDFP